MQRTCVVVFLVGTCVLSWAQDDPRKEIDPETVVDRLLGFQDDEAANPERYENLAQLLSSRLNINTATAEDLRFLNLLTEIQIQNLLNYRKQNGELLSAYELQAVPEFDLVTISKIIPFVTVSTAVSSRQLLHRILKEENNYLILRYDRSMETKKGFSKNMDSRFKGDENELYARFRTSNPGDFSLGFTVEKDAGESLAWNRTNRQYGFDYYSAHLQLQNKGKLKNFIVGDFQSQFGQGLLLGGGFGYGKSSETITTVRKSNLGFLPYTSANEAGYKRGIAATYEVVPSIYLSAFYSATRRDASLSTDTSGAIVSSFQSTGLHRNVNELKGRKQVQEKDFGVILNYKKNNLDAGLIFNTMEYDHPVHPNPQPYNQFAFSGKRSAHTGVFLNYTLHNITLFSEVAQTRHAGFGFTGGLLASLSAKFDLAFHVRHYQRNFSSLYSNAFAESSQPQNESGVYWGWKYAWSRQVSVSGYTDLFKFPWLRFGCYAPSAGHEWLFRINYQPSKSVLIYLQAREESKGRNTPNATSTNYTTAMGVKHNYWINFDYSVTRQIKLKTRAQLSTYEIMREVAKGLALVQDISIDVGKLNLTGRYALFDTHDFNNRQYVFERDVWLAYSLPAYSGKGIRNYILAEYTVNRQLSFWVRYARTRYANQNEIGSGADVIRGDTKTDVRLQARIRF